nr:hypothetical protein [Virgibacillus sp.]
MTLNEAAEIIIIIVILTAFKINVPDKDSVMMGKMDSVVKKTPKTKMLLMIMDVETNRVTVATFEINIFSDQLDKKIVELIVFLYMLQL